MLNNTRLLMQRITFIDKSLFILSILFWGLTFLSRNEIYYPIIYFEPYILAYLLLRILFCFFQRWFSSFLVLITVVLCMRELILGYSQLFDNIGELKAQDACIGSFSNSGPFGCFLAVCCSLFVGVLVKESNVVIKSLLAVLSFLSFVLLACTFSRAAFLSLSVSLFLISLKNEDFATLVRNNWALFIVAVLLSGTFFYMIKKPSTDGRILMYTICTQIIKDNGLKGEGIGNFSGEYGKAQARFFSDFMKDSADDMDISNIPDNMRMVADCPRLCFNEYIKMGVENGPIAMLLMVGIMLLGIVQTYKSNSIWCYPLVVLSVFACFSYPFEVDILLLITILCLASNNNQQSNNLGGLFFLVFVVVFGSVYYVRKEQMYNKNIKAYSSFYSKMFRNRSKLYYIHDTDVIPEGIYHESMLFNYGQSLSEDGDYIRSDSVLKLGTKISSDPMFWNVMGNNCLAQGKYREAEDRYKHAFYMVPNRLYPLYLLAKLYHTEGDTVKFLDMADKVETFIPKVESVNTERLRNEIRELKSGYTSEQYE